MADLVLIADVKAYLTLTEEQTEWDTLLPMLISGVSALVRREVGCDVLDPASAYLDERASGTGTSMLYLANWPVTAALSVDDADGNVYVEDVDFTVEYFGLRRMGGGVWTKGSGNYYVSYEAGFDELPDDIALVCYESIARRWKTVKESGWGETSKSVGDGSTASSNTDAALTTAHKSILEKYKRIRI